MLRRAVDQTIEANKAEATAPSKPWNEQSEWHTPNALPSLDTSKALMRPQFRSIQSNMNRSPNVKAQFVIAKQKRTVDSKAFSNIHRHEENRSEDSQLSYRFKKHLEVSQMKQERSARLESQELSN